MCSKHNKMKTKRICYIVLALFTLVGTIRAQTIINGSVNTSSLLNNVQRNFSGFNNGEGFIDNIFWNYGPNANLSVCNSFYTVFNANLGNNIYYRFPGGMIANFYNRNNGGYGNIKTSSSPNINNIVRVDNPFYMPSAYMNTFNRNLVYDGIQTYYNYTGSEGRKSNIIFPYINAITESKNYDQTKCVFDLNMLAHYRNYQGGTQNNYNGVFNLNVTYNASNTKSELFSSDSVKVKNINSLADFNSSTLSAAFKDIVNQNLDAFITLVENNVYVDKVEFGNELFNAAQEPYLFTHLDVDYNTFVTQNLDRKIWNSKAADNSYVRSLSIFSNLARMYRILIKETLLNLSASHPGESKYVDMYNTIEFGVPLANIYTGDNRIKVAGEFFLQPHIKSYIGLTGYAYHPYATVNVSLTANTNSDTNTLKTEFNNIRDDLKTNYFNGFMKNTFIQKYNTFPSGSKYWITEWNIGLDGNNPILKVGNTLLHSMFYFDQIMTFFDINANKNLVTPINNTNAINLANYHVVAQKDGITSNFVRFPNKHQTTYTNPLTTSNSVNNDVKYNSPYYAHLLLNPILNDNVISYINNTNGGFNTVTNCDIRTFYKEICGVVCCDADIYIYFSNKSGVEYTIDINNALPAFIQNSNNCQVVSKNYIYANNMYASMGKTTFRASDQITTDPNVSIQRIFNQIVPSSSYNNIILPKYSIGYILVSRKSGSGSNTLCSCGGGGTSGKIKSSTIDLNSQTLKFNVYPNPNTTGKQVIEFEEIESGDGIIEIFDISGKNISTLNVSYSAGNNEVFFNTSGLSKGMYVFRIKTKNISSSKKIDIF